MKPTLRLVTLLFAFALTLTASAQGTFGDEWISGGVGLEISGFMVSSTGWVQYECRLCTDPGYIASGSHVILDGGVGMIAANTFGAPAVYSYSDTLSAGTIYEHCYQAQLEATGRYGVSNRYGSATLCAPPQYDDCERPPADGAVTQPSEGEIGCYETPIILNPVDGAYDLTSLGDGVRFDIRDEGYARRIAWTKPSSDAALLALDRNGNGTIDSGAELFGNATPLRSGGRAKNGFEALYDLDLNGDGILDGRDAVWGSLLLWTDRDHDGVSTPSELRSIAGSGVTWISTSYQIVGRTDQWGNYFRYTSKFGASAGTTGAALRPFYDVLLRSTK